MPWHREFMWRWALSWFFGGKIILQSWNPENLEVWILHFSLNLWLEKNWKDSSQTGLSSPNLTRRTRSTRAIYALQKQKRTGNCICLWNLKICFLQGGESCPIYWSGSDSAVLGQRHWSEASKTCRYDSIQWLSDRHELWTGKLIAFETWIKDLGNLGKWCAHTKYLPASWAECRSRNSMRVPMVQVFIKINERVILLEKVGFVSGPGRIFCKLLRTSGVPGNRRTRHNFQNDRSVTRGNPKVHFLCDTSAAFITHNITIFGQGTNEFVSLCGEQVAGATSPWQSQNNPLS